MIGLSVIVLLLVTLEKENAAVEAHTNRPKPESW